MEPHELPGSVRCLGCAGLTFRNREDGLCPRCACGAENLIEQIELDGMERDLALMADFDAYYERRERERESAQLIAARLPGTIGGPLFQPARYNDAPFATGPFPGLHRSA